MPVNESEVKDLHRCLLKYPQGQMSDGWGEVSHWPADRMEEGDWSPAIWRSPRVWQKPPPRSPITQTCGQSMIYLACRFTRQAVYCAAHLSAQHTALPADSQY